MEHTMPQLTEPQFPLEKLSFTQQPFGVRVKCVLDSSLVKEQDCITGAAIEATGGMEPYFGLSAFSKGIVKEFGRSLGEFLGRLDKQNGTTLVYWGTGDAPPVQSLGFKSSSEWGFFQFGRPASGFGRRSELMPVLRYFLEGEHVVDLHQSARPGQEGIYVFLLDGGMDDYPHVLDYLCQFVGDVIGGRRKMSRLVFVGFGDNFIETSQGQLHALAALSNRTEPPIISSLMVSDADNLIEDVKDAVMVYVKASRKGAVLDEKGKLIHDFPNGLPGAFQFYIPSGSGSFTIRMGDNLYIQPVSI
jgi:hypothetical protein